MMKTLLLLLSVAIYGFAGTLFIAPDGVLDGESSGIIVYRTAEHIVVFGNAADGEKILDTTAEGLENYAMVTIRNENGLLQATELGKIVYRDGRTLIVRLNHIVRGNFIRSGIHFVQPLVETHAPAVPIPIPLSRGYDDVVSEIVDAINEDSLIARTTHYENYLTRYSNTDNYDTSCIWSNDVFTGYGLDSEIRHFSMLGYDCQNVIATQTGTTYPEKYWIICGHLDSISPQSATNAPGADDNGSGSTAVIEAARIMSQYDFEYTVRYILWGGEEQGLYGSAHYADSVAAAGDEILGVINLDMIYYGPPPNDIAQLHYNTASYGLGLAFDAISDTYVPVLEKEVASPPVSASDHSSFWNVGYPALLNIEKEVWNNPHYHQTSDIMANYLEYFPFGTNMTKASIAVVAYLAVPDGTGIEGDFSQNMLPEISINLQTNPVATTAFLNVNLPATSSTHLRVYDLSGREVISRMEVLPAGSNQLEINFESHSAGMYLIDFEAGNSTASATMILLP